MKKYLALIFLLFVLVAGCSINQWEEYISDEGKYKVDFPGNPEIKTQKVNTKIGEIQITMAMLESNNIAYMASFNDYTSEFIKNSNEKDLLDGARDGAVANVQGKLLSELIIELNNIPGREIKIETADGKNTIIQRVYLAGSRLYQVSVVTPKTQSFDKNINKYLDSFKIR